MAKAKKRRWFRWLRNGAIAIIATLILVLAGGYLWLLNTLPNYDDTISIANLTTQTRVERDADGIPTIIADNTGDAYRTLGFIHAQDRFFQMEITRRVGAGRLSEGFGDAPLSIDRLMRTLGFYQLAQQSVELMDAPARAALDAYAQGVNAWLDSDAPLPPEFLVLRVKPEPWVPADSIVWGRLMAFQLSGNMGAELLRARMAETLSPEQIGDLWAQDPPGTAETLTDLAALLQALPLQDLAATLSAVQASGSASNEWIVDGTQSATGKPFLANDPHLGFTAPGLWYLARIVTPELEITGATVPGVPFTLVGHNSHIAWGFTTTHADTQDIFIEKLDADNDANFITVDGSRPFTTREETIKIRGQDEPETLQIRSTPNGPVISDVSTSAEKATTKGHVLSLGFTALSAQDRTAEALFRLNTAQNWTDFTGAMRLFNSPAQNIAYADTAGNIGFFTPARLPLRKSGDGRLPLPGWTGENGWRGTVPFDQLPQAFNPPAGHIINANNRLAPPGAEPFIAHDWPASYRADRITELLAATPQHDAQTFAAIQTDTVSGLSRTLLPTLLELSSTIPGSENQDILASLAAWDGDMDYREPEPLIFMSWLDALGHRLYDDELGDLADDFAHLRPRTLEHLLANRPQWCDDITTDTPEDCTAQVTAAFDDAMSFLTDRLGKDWQDWLWGDLHQARFSHQIFGRIPLIKKLSDTLIPSSGGGFTINRGLYISGTGKKPFSHIVGAGYRAIYDLNDLSKSQFIIATGQSGHFLSPFYANLTRTWRDGEYLTMTGPKEDPKTTLVLHPTP